MCTSIRFTDTAGNMYFGRNLDWTQSYDEHIVITPSSATVPTAFERDEANENAHNVIGVGIIVEGVPLYFDCGNDAGLAIAGLNFPQSAQYANECKEDSNNIAAYEFPFWVTRNHSSVQELKSALGAVTIVARPLNENLPVANLHWIIGDATESIVVECMADGMHVWENDIDVLTNEPDFKWQRTNLSNYLALSSEDPSTTSWGSAQLAPFGAGAGMHGIPGDYSGPARFVKAAFVNSHYPSRTGEAANITRLYKSLSSVAVPEGCARMKDGSYEKTLYTSCFSASTMTYYYATYDDPQIKAYRLYDNDLSSAVPFFAKEIN